MPNSAVSEKWRSAEKLAVALPVETGAELAALIARPPETNDRDRRAIEGPRSAAMRRRARERVRADICAEA